MRFCLTLDDTIAPTFSLFPQPLVPMIKALEFLVESSMRPLCVDEGWEAGFNLFDDALIPFPRPLAFFPASLPCLPKGSVCF